MDIFYKCKNCNTQNVITVDETIDLTNNADLLKKILDNSHFEVGCDKCKEKNLVIYPALIQDDRLKFYIKINTNDEKLVLLAKDDYKIRIVKDLNQANEKIRCFNYMLDDRIVEIIKLKIKKDLEINNPGLKIHEMYFFRMLNGYLEFLVFTKEELLGTMKYQTLGYFELEKEHKDKFDDTLQVVDENFAKDFVIEAEKLA